MMSTLTDQYDMVELSMTSTLSGTFSAFHAHPQDFDFRRHRYGNVVLQSLLD
jgi:hypothetical protein